MCKPQATAPGTQAFTEEHFASPLGPLYSFPQTAVFGKGMNELEATSRVWRSRFLCLGRKTSNRIFWKWNWILVTSPSYNHMMLKQEDHAPEMWVGGGPGVFYVSLPPQEALILLWH